METWNKIILSFKTSIKFRYRVATFICDVDEWKIPEQAFTKPYVTN